MKLASKRERISKLINDECGNMSVYTIKEILTDHGNLPYSICRQSDKEKSTAWEMTTVASFIWFLKRACRILQKAPHVRIDM